MPLGSPECQIEHSCVLIITTSKTRSQRPWKSPCTTPSATARQYFSSICLQILYLFSAKVLASAFNTWREETRKALQETENRTAALLHWTNSCAARAFSAWSEATRERARMRSACVRASMLWHHHYTAQAFYGWQSHAREAPAQRELVWPVTCTWASSQHCRRSGRLIFTHVG